MNASPNLRAAHDHLEDAQKIMFHNVITRDDLNAMRQKITLASGKLVELEAEFLTRSRDRDMKEALNGH